SPADTRELAEAATANAGRATRLVSTVRGTHGRTQGSRLGPGSSPGHGRLPHPFSRGPYVSSELPPPDRPSTPAPRDSLIDSVRPYLRASGNGSQLPADADVERALLRVQR